MRKKKIGGHTTKRTRKRMARTARRTFGTAGKPAPAGETRLRRGTCVKRVWKNGEWTTERTRTAKPPTKRSPGRRRRM